MMKILYIFPILTVMLAGCTSQEITIDVNKESKHLSTNETNPSDINLEDIKNLDTLSDDAFESAESSGVGTPNIEQANEPAQNDTLVTLDATVAQLQDLNDTLLQDLNDTLPPQNVTEVDNATIKRVVCLRLNATQIRDDYLANSTEEEEIAQPTVLMLNNTEFQARLLEEYNSNVTNRSGAAPCSLTLFYAPWCPFSANAAPHYNALARLFPDLKLYAVDSSLHHSLNTQFGIMALPTILIFHNSRPLYKYNYTEYSLTKYKEFVSILTGIEPLNVTLEPTEEDFLGPVPTTAVVGVNYYLWLACIFSLLYGLVQFSKSPVCEMMVDTVRNLWREAEIQHEHAE